MIAVITKSSQITHEPVMVSEVIENLHIKNQGRYIDATLGAAGYSMAIIKNGGTVLGIDADPKMLEIAKRNLEEACPVSENFQKPFKLALGNFGSIDKIASENGLTKVDGIVFDLGISNIHYLADSRGFSFADRDAILDMRLNTTAQSVKALDLVNGLREDQLTSLFAVVMGYEAGKIAKALVRARSLKPIETVGDLSDALSFLKRVGKTNPLTKVFLALRIAVNSELENLEVALNKAIELLDTGGVLAVVTFHSLEQKIVTRFVRVKEREGLLRIGDPISPSEEEVSRNQKSRSALLNVAIKN